MVTHALLNRQLRRIGLSADQVPSLDQWQLLLERVNKVYQEADQERYLHEIAIEVSSRETSELNKKLERAQQIAHLGYWYYDHETGNTSGSREMYDLFNCDPTQPLPSYDELIGRLSEEDRNLLKNLTDYALTEGEDYELEAKIKNKMNDKYRWLYLAGNPHKTMDGKPIRYLSGIVMDITRRKEYEEEMHKLNQQLITSARRAGMAEIATNVLHNIGNILNSVNVSAGLIQKYIQESGVDNIVMAIQMIHEHLFSLESYFTQDPKGKLLPTYLIEAKELMANSYHAVNHEIARLHENIMHIKDIVTMQNTLSGVSKMIEKISLPEVIEAAILLIEASLKKNGIELEKKYEYVLPILTDKNKIMQILINLLQNAKDALVVADPNIAKKLSIFTRLAPDKQHVEIIIADTGLGISAENLARIFSFGFTTKPKGHGFGLHSSALLVKELGGILHAESAGIGHGATFIMTLPLSSVTERSEIHEKQV